MAKPDTIIRGLWEFLQTCPYIEAGSPVTVDCMPMDNNAFTLAKRSGNPIVKMYTDGSSIRQYPFAVWYRGMPSNQGHQPDMRRLYGKDGCCRISHNNSDNE